jgi:hypothetical protein
MDSQQLLTENKLGNKSSQPLSIFLLSHPPSAAASPPIHFSETQPSHPKTKHPNELSSLHQASVYYLLLLNQPGL